MIRWNIDLVKKKTKELTNNEYKCLSKSYINSKTKLKFKCSEEHEFEMLWNNFKRGIRCPTCNKKRRKGKGNPNWRGGVKKKNLPLYSTYAPQLEFCEEVRKVIIKGLDLLQVRCTETSCRKWFIPTTSKVQDRINTINGKITGGQRFYCSDECKQKCSLYGQIKYPKGLKPDKSRGDQKEWAELVEVANGGKECIRCGSTDNPRAHHLEGIEQNPIMSADIDMGVILCKKCHEILHKQKDCRFTDLQKKNLCKEKKNEK